jgi:hypothetical protein
VSDSDQNVPPRCFRNASIRQCLMPSWTRHAQRPSLRTMLTISLRGSEQANYRRTWDLFAPSAPKT